jgi:hypothetical protein
LGETEGKDSNPKEKVSKEKRAGLSESTVICSQENEEAKHWNALANLGSGQQSEEDDGRDGISAERTFGKDMRRLLKLVCRAFLNPSELQQLKQPCSILRNSAEYLSWDIEEYYFEHVKSGRDPRRLRFPNPKFGAFSEPLTVVDCKGRIVLWYLPGLLSISQQVRI